MGRLQLHGLTSTQSCLGRRAAYILLLHRRTTASELRRGGSPLAVGVGRRRLIVVRGRRLIVRWPLLLLLLLWGPLREATGGAAWTAGGRRQALWARWRPARGSQHARGPSETTWAGWPHHAPGRGRPSVGATHVRARSTTALWYLALRPAATKPTLGRGSRRAASGERGRHTRRSRSRWAALKGGPRRPSHWAALLIGVHLPAGCGERRPLRSRSRAGRGGSEAARRTRGYSGPRSAHGTPRWGGQSPRAGPRRAGELHVGGKLSLPLL